MIRIASSRLKAIALGFAAIAAGVALADPNGGSGCPSTSTSGTFCCAYPNGSVATAGTQTTSVNACCVVCSGANASGGFKAIFVGGKIQYCKVIQYNAGRYPMLVRARDGKLCVVTSPCSSTCF
jgi:hypothetical protein